MRVPIPQSDNLNPYFLTQFIKVTWLKFLHPQILSAGNFESNWKRIPFCCEICEIDRLRHTGGTLVGGRAGARELRLFYFHSGLVGQMAPLGQVSILDVIGWLDFEGHTTDRILDAVIVAFICFQLIWSQRSLFRLLLNDLVWSLMSSFRLSSDFLWQCYVFMTPQLKKPASWSTVP